MSRVLPATLKRPASLTRPTRILDKIEQHVMAEAADHNAERDKDHIHPSEICKSDWCPRNTWYRISGEAGDEEAHGYRTQAIFEEGHNIHAKWQQWLREIGVLHGFWKCSDCGYRFEALAPKYCEDCLGLSLVYKEVPLGSAAHRIIGHSDGRLIDEKGMALLEVKSVGVGTLRYIAPTLYKRFSSGEITLDKMWQEIKRPFAEHLRQGMLYLYCTGLTTIIFIYECKWNQQVKEFTITYNEEIVRPMLEGCEQVVTFLRLGFPPPRPDWAKEDNKKCKACPYRSDCYGSDKEASTTARPVAVRKATAGARRGGTAGKAAA